MVMSCKDLKIGDRVRIRGEGADRYGTVCSVAENFAAVREPDGSFDWWSPQSLTLVEPEGAYGPGTHKFTIHFPFTIGDRVRLFGSAIEATVRELRFKILDRGLVVRSVIGEDDVGGVLDREVEALVLCPPKPKVYPPPLVSQELRLVLGMRVTLREGGGDAGTIRAIRLENDGRTFAGVQWPGGHSLMHYDINELREAL